jgi:hypothetical protein
MSQKIKFSLLTSTISALSILAHGLPASAQQAEYTVPDYTYRILDTSRACQDLYMGRKSGTKSIESAWPSTQDGPDVCRLAGFNNFYNPYTGNWEKTHVSTIAVKIPRNRACQQQQGTSKTINISGYIYCVHNR